MAIDFDLAMKIAGPILGALAARLYDDIIGRRPKLVCFFLHSSATTMQAVGDAPAVRIHTHGLIVSNQGREAAKNVRVGHVNLPNFEIFPDTPYEITSLPGGTKEILIQSLAPKEQVSINYIYFPPMLYRDVNSYVKSDDGAAKVITVLPAPQLPTWMYYGAWCLIAYGATALIYTIISAIGR